MNARIARAPKTPPSEEPMHRLLHHLPPDDWEAPRQLERTFGPAADDVSFLLIRPEAVWQGFAHSIISRVAAHDLVVLDAQTVRPHPRLMEELYRYTQVRLMAAGNRPMWWYTPRYYDLGPALALIVGRTSDRGAAAGRPSASERLAEIKGPSNPALGRPGQLRYDHRSQNMVMCVVHSSDASQTMLREACLFFGADRVARAIAGPRPARGRHVTAVPHGRSGTGPCPEPHFHQVLADLQRRIVVELGRHKVVGTGDVEQVAAGLQGLVDGPMTDPRYDRRTAELLRLWDQPYARKLLAALSGSPRDDAAFLSWSARLTDTSTALVDRVLARLETQGYVLSPYERLLLETGLGFHPWIAAGFRPATDDVALVRAEREGADR